MRRLLHQLGVRQGISLGLLIAVVLVVVVAKLLPHRGGDALTYNGVVADPGSAQAFTPPTGSAAPTAIASPLLHRPAPPSTGAGTAGPQSVAKSFAAAWLRNGVTAAVWLHDVTKYTTPAVTAQLAEADPANVPATRVTRAPSVVDDTAERCEVKVPMDTGTLLLTLQLTGGRWLVDNIDWAPPVPSATTGGTS